MASTLDERIDLGSGAFNIRIDGAGDTAPWLTFSNSHATDLHLWDSQVAALGHDFRLLHYDTRGHGATGASPGAYMTRAVIPDAAHMAHIEQPETFNRELRTFLAEVA